VIDRTKLHASLCAVAMVALLAGCASANKTTSNAAASGSTSGMAGMSNGSGGNSSAGMEVDGIKPIPIQPLAVATWQGMKIEARAMTAVPFVVFNGNSEQVVRPGPKTSFHLMVLLDDARTGVAIPYASVWATITHDGKVVYDERQWPMLSEYMGPHYGNNVALPGAGKYQLNLLISPPVSARHLEYQHVWLTPHRVSSSFNWKPVS
jgi:Fe2+ transport protein